jgi:hypothetical protein
MAARLSQERLRLAGDDDLPRAPGASPARLPTARRSGDLGALPGDRTDLEQAAGAGAVAGGDDDRDDECDVAVPEAAQAPGGEDDFYAEAWETR